MSSTIHRLSGVDGFSLEIPDELRRAPELETRSVCLVAHAEPWSWPQAFRPNLTAEVTALTPDRATLVQLSSVTIAAQIALGAHVAACDIWPGPEDSEGRRIISLYPEMDTTVVQLQYVSICGGRAITVSIQQGADKYRHGLDVFRHVVGTIRCAFDDPDSDPEPDPATMPRLDPFAQGRGMEVEYLGGVRAAQPYRSAGPVLDEAQLDALRRGKLPRGTESAALQAGGFVSGRGRLTDVGEAAHRALSSPAREVTLEVVTDDDPRVAVLHAHQRGHGTAVVASVPPGESGTGSTLDVIASRTTPIALARWLGLAPAWTFSIAEGDSPTLRLDAAVLDARLTSTGAPAPDEATEALARMWAQPWQVASLHASQPGAYAATIVSTPESGSFRLERDRSAGEASLTPVPSAQYLLDVLQLGGFDVGVS
jgi:hypothetical protein